MLREVRVTGVVSGIGEGPGQANLLVELTDRQEPGVAGELTGRWFDDDRGTEKIETLWPGGWYTHRWSPGKRPGGSPAQTRTEAKGSELCALSGVEMSRGESRTPR